MIKKLLLASLTVFSFIGLTACGNGKKLTAEEAKAEIKQAQANTAKAIKNGKGIKIDENIKLGGTVSAKNVKVDSNLGSLIPEIKTAKLQADVTEKGGFAFDVENFKFMTTASEEASVKLSYTAGDSTEKFEVGSKGNGEIYLVKNENKFNIYAKGNMDNTFNIPESFKNMIDTEKYSKLEGKINVAYEVDPEDDNKINDFIDAITTGSYEEIITSYDFSTLIKDWTIFSKKGNTITADCSNLTAFGISEEKLAELAKAGLTLKLSKFQINLTKNKEIAGLDIDASLKGTVDLSKQDIDAEDIKDIIVKFKPEAADLIKNITVNGISGTLTIDATYGLDIDVAYTQETITVPEDLANTEEISLMMLIYQLIFGVSLNTPATPATPAA